MSISKEEIENINLNTKENIQKTLETVTKLKLSGDISLQEFRAYERALSLAYRIINKKKNNNSDDEMVVVTSKLLEQGKSRHGSWNEEQLNALGSTMKKNKGWKKKLIGKRVTKQQVDLFLALTNAHLPLGDHLP